jgi:ankyrin repeat protein
VSEPTRCPDFVVVIKFLSPLCRGASEPYHRLKERVRKAREEEKGGGGHDSALSTSRRMERNEEDDQGLDEMKFETADRDEDLPADEDPTKAIEISIDLTKNTPLLWAAHKGKLGVIWHLLEDGYSPNDVDKMDNNALHLCAAHGDLKILKVLIDDGGVANVVNHYKNHPIDMSKTKEVRDMIAVAAEVGASMTEKDIAEKHERNMRQVRYATERVDAVSNLHRNSHFVVDVAVPEDGGEPRRHGASGQ